MAMREIKIISETDIVTFEEKVASFMARSTVDDIRFSITDTEDGVLYSVMLSIIPEELLGI
jgi:hypothetical protein